ncbi:MAG: peptidylprolyl isomerase [Bacillota bacterium]|nr:peptidylprolyl isomerase [Bacillota bacterium]
MGSVEVFESDLDMMLASLAPEIKTNFQGEEGRKRMLDELIFQELFYLDALEKGLDNTPEFTQKLNAVKRGMLSEMNVAMCTSDVHVDDEDIRKFYNENGDKMAQSEVKASHILVSTEKEAKEIRERIKTHEDFENQAKEHSMCPSKDVGGDLGFFGRGMMVPEFEEVAFSIPKGEISEPVKTQFGYHLICKTDEKAAQKPSFDQAKEIIAHLLQHQKQNEVFMKKVGEFEKKYEVKRF